MEVLAAKYCSSDFMGSFGFHAHWLHFSNLFRKSTGMPPINYFIHLKMQKACQLLYGPTLKIKEIAYTVGYDDLYYFSRIFKKLMGLSPEQYRVLQKE